VNEDRDHGARSTRFTGSIHTKELAKTKPAYPDIFRDARSMFKKEV